jgi:hypothetical protein
VKVVLLYYFFSGYGTAHRQLEKFNIPYEMTKLAYDKEDIIAR